MVNKLNLEFQSETLKLHVLLKRISALYTTILRNFIKKEHLTNFNLNDVNIKNPRIYTTIDNMYFGAKFELFALETNINSTELNNCKLKCLDFYIELATQIRFRFDFNDEVLKFAEIIDPKTLFNDNNEFLSLMPIVHKFD